MVVGFALFVARRPAPPPDCGPPDTRRSFFVRKGQLVVITSAQGAALIQFTGERPSAAEYRWRFRPAGPGPETAGVGRVFEAYSEQRVGPNEVKVTDAGGRVAVKAGPFILEWSSGGTTGHYLYIDPSIFSLPIATGEFESFSLGSGGPAA